MTKGSTPASPTKEPIFYGISSIAVPTAGREIFPITSRLILGSNCICVWSFFYIYNLVVELGRLKVPFPFKNLCGVRVTVWGGGGANDLVSGVGDGVISQLVHSLPCQPQKERNKWLLCHEKEEGGLVCRLLVGHFLPMHGCPNNEAVCSSTQMRAELQ